MSGCALQIAVIADAMESGAQAWPIFFAGPNCDVSQYPAAGQTLPSSLINGSIFNLRGQACLKANGAPDDVVSTSKLGKGENESIPISTCPLPAIQSMIIPDGISITFFSSGGSFPQFIKDPGQLKISADGLTNANIMQISTAINNLTWKSSINPNGNCVGDPGSGVYDDFYNSLRSPQNARNSFDNQTAQMTNSNLSCGISFWPSLTSVMYDGYAYATYNGNVWAQVGRDVDWQDRGPSATYCYARNGGTIGGNVASFVRSNDDRNIGIYCSQGGRGYSCADCLQGNDAGVHDGVGGTHPNGTQHGICACTSVACDGNECGCDSGDQCMCEYEAGRQANGNMQNIQISQNAGDWTAQQFLYCTGQQKLTIGTIPIQRYGQGTPACDSIVPQFCANTAYLIANPFAQKACACINEQARLELQFQGLDLPVQCFTDVCSEADPQVYKTANQLKGCSARLCVQILTINGSAIASEGFQTMTCDGQVYSTSTGTTNATPVPVSTSTPGGPSLGIVFYVALGLLVFMVILLVVWGIRRFVIQKRKQNRQNELIVKSFENVLKK